MGGRRRCGRQGAGVRRDDRARPPAGAERVRPGGLRALRHLLPRVRGRPRARRGAGLPLRCRGPARLLHRLLDRDHRLPRALRGRVVRGPAAGGHRSRRRGGAALPRAGPAVPVRRAGQGTRVPAAPHPAVPHPVRPHARRGTDEGRGEHRARGGRRRRVEPRDRAGGRHARAVGGDVARSFIPPGSGDLAPAPALDDALRPRDRRGRPARPGGEELRLPGGGREARRRRSRRLLPGLPPARAGDPDGLQGGQRGAVPVLRPPARRPARGHRRRSAEGVSPDHPAGRDGGLAPGRRALPRSRSRWCSRVFGEEWRAAAAPMAFVAIWAGLASLASMPGAVFKALGRSWLLTCDRGDAGRDPLPGDLVRRAARHHRGGRVAGGGEDGVPRPAGRDHRARAGNPLVRHVPRRRSRPRPLAGDGRRAVRAGRGAAARRGPRGGDSARHRPLPLAAAVGGARRVRPAGPSPARPAPSHDRDRGAGAARARAAAGGMRHGLRRAAAGRPAEGPRPGGAPHLLRGAGRLGRRARAAAGTRSGPWTTRSGACVTASGCTSAAAPTGNASSSGPRPAAGTRGCG